MKKSSICLLVLLLFCVEGLAGCGFLDKKEAETSSQPATEEEKIKEKETASEENNEIIKKKEKDDNKASEEENKATEKAIEENDTSSEQDSVNQGASKDSSNNTEDASSQVDWGSTWTRDINTDRGVIEITQVKGDTLKFTLKATHTQDVEAARNGLVSVGDVGGTAKVKGNVATQITDDVDGGCLITLTNHTNYIEVGYQPSCTSSGGGIGVYYDGKYKKGNIPETDWWKEEGSDGSTTEEPKEEQEQSTEQEQATEGTEGTAEEETPVEGTQTLITREQAIQRVKDYLNLSLENMHYVDDGDTATGKYLIRVYQYQEATADSTEHEAPYGYFIVDPKTGEVTDVNAD